MLYLRMKGIYERFAPHEIVTGRRLNLNHLKSPYGEYIEASMDDDVTNDMKGITHLCISLGHSRNWHGSKMCFDLDTGKLVLIRTITRLPTPERAIRIMNNYGKSQKNAGCNNKLELWDCMKNKYNWENEDLDVSDGNVEVAPLNKYPHIPAEIPGVLM